MLGNFRVASRVSSTLSRLKREGEISFEMPQWKRTSSCIEGRISWFFSSCCRKHGVPLELQWGPQGPAHVASGKSCLHVSCKGPLGIPLQSVPAPRSSSGAEARTSGFFSSADMDLGVPVEFPQWFQASSRVETWKCTFLLRRKSSVWLPVELAYGSVAYS